MVSYSLVGIPGIIIGLIFIVQGYRGAGKATAALGGGCVILGLFSFLAPMALFSGSIVQLTTIGMGLCGLAAIVLAFREHRASV